MGVWTAVDVGFDNPLSMHDNDVSKHTNWSGKTIEHVLQASLFKIAQVAVFLSKYFDELRKDQSAMEQSQKEAFKACC